MTPASGPIAAEELPADLFDVLAESRERGLLGPGPIPGHVEHALGFEPSLGPGFRVVDLGSGGGVPGLVLAVARPDLSLTLLDAAARRCEVLRAAVDELDLSDRVAVLHARAEDAARDPSLRQAVDAVVARSFGPPAVVAECARGLLRSGGLLVVSEPPEATTGDRWPVEGLRSLGYGRARPLQSSIAGFVVIRADGPCSDAIPRRAGMPERRPRF